MYKLTLSLSIFLLCVQTEAQYKSDNVLFKTVYPEDLAKQLRANPGYLLLDVRSKEENTDSAMMGMNIGRFKNAKNIDVAQLASRLNEIKDYKNTPIFVYCSHSQRSRRASKLLADNGFTKVYNINGGMTALIQANYGLGGIYETKNKFSYLSPLQFCKEVNNKSILLLDVRPDSLYNGATMDEQDNAIGKFKNARHIAIADLDNGLGQLPKDKMIFVIDAYGNESNKAAKVLAQKGYNNVKVLFDGMYNLIITPGVTCKNEIWQQNRKYHTLTTDDFNDMAARDKNIMILDVRNPAEFNNQFKDAYRNTGHIKNAVNIYGNDLAGKLSKIAAFKNKPVVIYNFSSNVDAYRAAATLVNNGFTNVNILAGGIFTLRWKAANQKGKVGLKDWVVDIPTNNL